ncbi:hypothetical protein G6F56_003531 [Rhizopus delemar]|nr:hypothetical protein G6F56_003531 [Rhizopus delemar]
MVGYRLLNFSTEQRVKTLAYADDICTILDSESDYDRFQYHLYQYAMVFNAKFNQEKTEAFSLNGRSEESWKLLLDD